MHILSAHSILSILPHALTSSLCSPGLGSWWDGTYVQAVSCIQREVCDGRALAMQGLISLISVPVVAFCFSWLNRSVICVPDGVELIWWHILVIWDLFIARLLTKESRAALCRCWPLRFCWWPLADPPFQLVLRLQRVRVLLGSHAERGAARGWRNAGCWKHIKR